VLSRALWIATSTSACVRSCVNEVIFASSAGTLSRLPPAATGVRSRAFSPAVLHVAAMLLANLFELCSLRLSEIQLT
jgi:hypothetical protein